MNPAPLSTEPATPLPSSPTGDRLPAPGSRVLTPALRHLLVWVLVLAGLLAINSLYLVAVTTAEWLTGRALENGFYLAMFLAHLGLGLLLIAPALVFGLLHLRRAWRRPNRYAVAAGLALYLTLLLVFGSGVLLTRFGVLEINDPLTRQWLYWLHILTPLLAIWLFVLHRLAGPTLRWRQGLAWAGAAVAFTAAALTAHLVIPATAPELVRPWTPALAQVPNAPIPPARLMRDAYCAQCHTDIAARHAGSVHAMSSFNNPTYRVAVQDTRAAVAARDGGVQAARLCAVCHDQVPLFSGRFDDPDYDPDADPGAAAGVTCLGCHAITAVGSPRGNGDYALAPPPEYPFAFSDNPFLQYLNRQLIKAKPAFHRRTLLAPVLREPEFCATCHKVHLPPALNQYRWLRGQNHYDSFLMSGVSGHRVDSFYYPDQARSGCNECHMPARADADPAARRMLPDGQRAVHDHRFAAANTAVPLLLGRPVEDNAERVRLLRQAARLDLFTLYETPSTDGSAAAEPVPLRPALPTLVPGRRYTLDLVVRTRGVGHALTQGTADSNEVWLEVRVLSGDRVIAHSGGLDAEGQVDDWAWFGNAYLLDRDGNRIERRNVQDLLVALYDHQTPPGAAAVVHYDLPLPTDLPTDLPLTIEAALRYRKFDSRFYRHAQGSAWRGNDLPIVTLAADQVLLPLAGPDGRPGARVPAQASPIAVWERWNDYGIGLFLQGARGESRQAEAAFALVDRLGSDLPAGRGHADGPLNLARVFYREGRLEEAAAALERAAQRGAPPWVVAWYTGLIARDLGDLDAAIAALEPLAETRFQEARSRGFDFSQDYRMLTEFGRTLYERARLARGPARSAERAGYLAQARARLEQALAIDPEHAAAHHNLSLVLAEAGDTGGARHHLEQHEFFRVDDNAVARAVTIHRERNPAADHAAEPVAVYALHPAPQRRAALSPFAAEWGTASLPAEVPPKGPIAGTQ